MSPETLTLHEALEARHKYKQPAVRVNQRVLYFDGTKTPDPGYPATVTEVAHNTITVSAILPMYDRLQVYREIPHETDPMRRHWAKTQGKGYWQHDPDDPDTRLDAMQKQVEKLATEVKEFRSFNEMLAQEIAERGKKTDEDDE